MFQVEQAYYRLLGLELLVRVNELSLQNIGRALDAAQRRRESGLATVADVYRAETQVAQAELNLMRSRGEFEKARGQLATAVGLPVNQSLQAADVSTTCRRCARSRTSVDELLDRARATRPDLVAAEAQARGRTGYGAAPHRRPACRRSRSPARRAHVLSGRATIEAAAGDQLQPSLEPAHSDLHRLSRSIRDRVRRKPWPSRPKLRRDVLYRQTELDVWQAYYDVQTAASGIGSTEAQVKSAEQTAQATLARYQAGFGSILDLITAQQDEVECARAAHPVVSRLVYGARAAAISRPGSATSLRRQSDKK